MSVGGSLAATGEGKRYALTPSEAGLALIVDALESYESDFGRDEADIAEHTRDLVDRLEALLRERSDHA